MAKLQRVELFGESPKGEQRMISRKPTDEEFDKIIESSSLNRKERRLVKFKREGMKQTMTFTNRPNFESLLATNPIKNSQSQVY